jgi:hypothetical protein
VSIHKATSSPESPSNVSPEICGVNTVKYPEFATTNKQKTNKKTSAFLKGTTNKINNIIMSLSYYYREGGWGIS